MNVVGVIFAKKLCYQAMWVSAAARVW